MLATPGALAESRLPSRVIETFVTVAPGDQDALERVRNAAARLAPATEVRELSATQETRAFVVVRRGLFAAAAGVLLLIGASLIVGALEQLRERRRALAVLVAFETKPTTMAGSVLWQTALPVGLGLAVAVAVGVALGALLLAMASQPLVLDWGAILALTAAGGVVVLLVTLLTMPALWRLMRPDGLRTE